MSRVSIDKVQAWFESSKLPLNSGDDLPEEIHAVSIAFAQLDTKFETSAWIDDTTTPGLVQTILSMLIAAYRYNSIYSETLAESEQSYGEKLEEKAMLLLQQIVDGQIILTDVTEDGPAVTGTLSFYPTDNSTLIDDEDDAGRKFTMGQVF